ncbi:uncharacterized protein TRIADDRAFT_58053 [Trichoplax adhaerens]|uniref:CTF/NF-I domain-containing protein n=1 Tax=Trichoplax adhaerens TaxID=10228 RepID=B3S2K0_TRIAD|nr:hypothetical protein TRIADDRAFT_58053 [Trichoplax adhaerens]EDV23107.1 hypothetical protein TRIADDRAFT_58053 [Trichoplax adhaerens]|eukprot:XP_002114017.1 hypothetical protein TRIADDRAFT_58053 [Trichoplax adhaerens]
MVSNRIDLEELQRYIHPRAYGWFHLQQKRRHYNSTNRRSNMIKYDNIKNKQEDTWLADIKRVRNHDKMLWCKRLLIKILKDVKTENKRNITQWIRDRNTDKCIISNPDYRGKMRRIDCLRQTDKVWRLDIVMAILFTGVPLESTDSDRICKSNQCQNPDLCISPFHVQVVARELDIFLYNKMSQQDSGNSVRIHSVFKASDFNTAADAAASVPPSIPPSPPPYYRTAINVGNLAREDNNNHETAVSVPNDIVTSASIATTAVNNLVPMISVWNSSDCLPHPHSQIISFSPTSGHFVRSQPYGNCYCPPSAVDPSHRPIATTPRGTEFIPQPNHGYVLYV